MERAPALNVSYQQRKDRKYKHPLPNAKNTPKDRREQYARLRALGATVEQARRLRDWHLG